MIPAVDHAIAAATIRFGLLRWGSACFENLCEALNMHTPGVDVRGINKAVSMAQVFAGKGGDDSLTKSLSCRGYQVE